MNGYIFILIIFILGLAAGSDSLTLAAGILLLIKALNMKILLPILEDRGVEIGLLFLMIAVLVALVVDSIRL